MAKRARKKALPVNQKRIDRAGGAGAIAGAGAGVLTGRYKGRPFAHGVGRGLIGGIGGEMAARGAYRAGSFPARKLKARHVINAGQQPQHYNRRKRK